MENRKSKEELRKIYESGSENEKELAKEVVELRGALRSISCVLGPNPSCSSNVCEGCVWEMSKAYEVAVLALPESERPYEHRTPDNIVSLWLRNGVCEKCGNHNITVRRAVENFKPDSFMVCEGCFDGEKMEYYDSIGFDYRGDI